MRYETLRLVKTYITVIVIITITQITSILLLLSSNMPGPMYSKIQTEYAVGRETPLTDSLVIVALTAITAVVIFKVIRKKAVTSLLKFGLAAITMLTSYQLLSLSRLEPSISLITSAALATLIIVGLRSKNKTFNNVVYATIGVLVGSFLAVFIAKDMMPIFITLFAAYDAVMVFKGPLGRIARNLSLMLLDFNVVKLGLGDIVFYVLIPSALTLAKNVEFAAYGILTTNTGVLLTLVLLAKLNRPLPGVTLPALFSLPLFL